MLLQMATPPGVTATPSPRPDTSTTRCRSAARCMRGARADEGTACSPRLRHTIREYQGHGVGAQSMFAAWTVARKERTKQPGPAGSARPAHGTAACSTTARLPVSPAACACAHYPHTLLLTSTHTVQAGTRGHVCDVRVGTLPTRIACAAHKHRAGVCAVCRVPCGVSPSRGRR